jgi:hypothetical protein
MLGVTVGVRTAVVLLIAMSTRPLEGGGVVLRDVTGSSGIRFELQNGGTPERHQIETMVGGVAVADFDGDGRPDIYFANGAPQPSLSKPNGAWHNRLYRNKGNWQFEDITATSGVEGTGFHFGVAAADYDNDGDVDLFVTGMPRSHLYRNRGDGRFEDVAPKAGVENRQQWPITAAWVDYDNDGALDLFVVNYVKWNPATEPFCGDADKKYRTYCHPRYYTGLPNTLFRNNKDGTFTDMSAASGIAAHVGKGMGVAIGDLDGDGYTDIAVANDTAPNFLFHNMKNGTFKEVGLPAGIAFNDDGRALSSMGVDFRDVDNDGRDDLFVTALSNETFPLYRNLGKRMFLDVTYPSQIGAATMALSGWSAGVFDFDNDGWKDLFAANGDVNDNTEMFSSRKSRQPNLLLLNKRDGTFGPSPVGAPALHRGAAFGDLDGDGRIDVVMTVLNGPPVLLRNESKGGHWIGLRLRGTTSNRDGIGARVQLATGAGKQWNHATSSVGYASSSEPVVHFGLGDATQVDAIEIRWPGGKVQTLEKLKADRYHTVTEP